MTGHLASRLALRTVDVDDHGAWTDLNQDDLRRFAGLGSLAVDEAARNVDEIVRPNVDSCAIGAVLELEVPVQHVQVGIAVTVRVPTTPVAGLRADVANPAIIAGEGMLPAEARALLGRRFGALIGRDDDRAG